jgi:hypothetical protein
MAVLVFSLQLIKRRRWESLVRRVELGLTR